jgi:hypothetical protein
MFFDFSRKGRWARKFKSKYRYVFEDPPDISRLRLLLGTARSGTSWTSKVLSKTALPCRFSSEPLFHIKPLLPYHKTGDHTAMPYDRNDDASPLLSAYQLVAHRQFDGAALPGNERNDPDWTICLVKEVHALMGTEALLRAWKIPVVFVLRDPIYIIDSLFAAQTLETIYMDHDIPAVQQDAFLDRFAAGGQAAFRKAFADNLNAPHRRRIMIDKLVCAHLLQKMFLALAREYPHARAFPYEDFCERPVETFLAAAAALGMPWDEKMAAALQKTMKGDAAAAADPYAVQRNTSAQKDREFMFLSPEEVELCRATLKNLGA